MKKAFKKAALQWHPDRCKRKRPVEECEARMEDVHLAQEVLSDDRRLQMWEAWESDRLGRGDEAAGRKPFGRPAGGAPGPDASPDFVPARRTVFAVKDLGSAFSGEEKGEQGGRLPARDRRSSQSSSMSTGTSEGNARSASARGVSSGSSERRGS
mmetsp:Transcript_104355/g.294932  ORF Transcript_104355/g.294932 Transcript_104355/m.294932 type:complete len:155 (-) Transcript_104355:634-1098(-)